MTDGAKYGLGGALVLVLAVGGELAYLHHRNQQDLAAPAARATSYKADPDDLVFLRPEHPMTFKDSKDLKGRTLWVSAGGQMDFYPFTSGHVDVAHSQGQLLGAEKIVVKDAVEQAVPLKVAIRIEQGDKQVFLVFTKPDAPDAAKLYAVPVGFRKGTDYTYSTDQIFFYQDPHQLFSYWGADVWKAIDEHRAIPGMSERQVQTALGQISTPHGDTIGERTVEYFNQGKPVLVTFAGGKATKIVDEKP